MSRLAGMVMKAWQLDRLGGDLRLCDVPVPEPRPGSVLVRIEASPLMTYFKAYAEGRLPIYQAPRTAFTPGGNAVGTIASVGPDVWHLRAGQRVVISAHITAGENVAEPGQFLLGITAFGPVAEAMQADWPNGTFAEYALVPKTCVTPVDGLDHLGPTELAASVRFAVPMGGLLRGGFSPGETLVVTGAAGAYGSAAVRLGVALGAERVVAAGRNLAKLEAVARSNGPRVVAQVLTGDPQQDAAALRQATGGGAHMALDLVGGATDSNATLAALRSLRRNGRLVLMGSMTCPLPISYLEMLINNWQVLGQFMYPADAFLRLFQLIRSGQLDVRSIAVRAYPLDALPAAAEAAATAQASECIMLTP